MWNGWVGEVSPSPQPPRVITLGYYPRPLWGRKPVFRLTGAVENSPGWQPWEAWKSAGVTSMKVVILAGGYGTRFGKATDFLPKPMIPVGPFPIVWHIMRHYAHYGYDDFILCTGYKSEIIKEFFHNLDVSSRRRAAADGLPVRVVSTTGNCGLYRPGHDDGRAAQTGRQVSRR